MYIYIYIFLQNHIHIHIHIHKLALTRRSLFLHRPFHHQFIFFIGFRWRQELAFGQNQAAWWSRMKPHPNSAKMKRMKRTDWPLIHGIIGQKGWTSYEFHTVVLTNMMDFFFVITWIEITGALQNYRQNLDEFFFSVLQHLCDQVVLPHSESWSRAQIVGPARLSFAAKEHVFQVKMADLTSKYLIRCNELIYISFIFICETLMFFFLIICELLTYGFLTRWTSELCFGG